jgi:hypothetical protein
MRRVIALVVVVALVAVGAFAASAWITGGNDEATPPPPTTTGPPPLTQLKIIFPEGFTVRDMADRVAAVRQIAIDKRRVTPRLTRQAYLRAVHEAVPPPSFRQEEKQGSLEGFLFPALYEFTQATSARELVSDQLTAFRQRFAAVDLRYARSKNLTPYDVLIIASMIEKETAVPRERRLVAAVIYNRLRNAVADETGPAVGLAVQHPPAPRPAPDADREPRPRVAPRRREPGQERRLPLLRAKAEVALALLHRERERLPPQGLRVRLRVQVTTRGAS